MATAESTALIDVGILFGAVALAGLVANRINQSVIPFYILVGMLLSEYVVGRVDFPALLGTDSIPHGSDLALANTDFVHVSAEIGIVLLLFSSASSSTSTG